MLFVCNVVSTDYLVAEWVKSEDYMKTQQHTVYIPGMCSEKREHCVSPHVHLKQVPYSWKFPRGETFGKTMIFMFFIHKSLENVHSINCFAKVTAICNLKHFHEAILRNS